ncbi:MAG: DUF4416 family protein [Candidatus Tectimicrobiota bacterium]
MGIIRQPVNVKLFCAILLAPDIPLSEVETVLEQTYGHIILRSPALPFTQTAYYEREMGASLTRVYVAFALCVPPDALATIKHTTNRLETYWTTSQEQRRINLDPGYLDLGKVVLATTKDHSHRVYIGDGMFAEVTLRYKHNSFQPWEWTYPDYRLPSTLAFFHQLRAIYKRQLQQQGTS